MNTSLAVTRADAVILGGGIMGCATALHLAGAGMRVAVVERGLVCAAASGVNAGTLSIQIKLPELVPYAMQGLNRWMSMSKRLGVDVGFHVRGGLMLAFTQDEAEMLSRQAAARSAAGAPITVVSARQAVSIDAGVTRHAVLASYCPIDAYANASRTGAAFRRALRASAVNLWEHATVERITHDNGRYAIHMPAEIVAAPRLVLATGAWLAESAALLNVDLPVRHRVNLVSVTERYPRIFDRIVSHVRGLLTLKQSDNGTVLIGGGWQGVGDLEAGATRLTTANLIGNLRLAQLAVPSLAKTRLLRSWHGFEAYVSDHLPLAGAVPGHDEAYVLGCVRGGWTIGPFIGELLAERVLGKSPAMPLFDPARDLAATY